MTCVNLKRVTNDRVLYRQRIQEEIQDLKSSLIVQSKKELHDYIIDLTDILLDSTERNQSYLKSYWIYGDVRKPHGVNRQREAVSIDQNKPRGMEFQSNRVKPCKES